MMFSQQDLSKQVRVSEINVIFAADDYFSLLLGVALCSLFEHKSNLYTIRVFVIDGGITPRSKSFLGDLEDQYGFKITYLYIDDKTFSGFPTNVFPIATYYRIAIGRLVPEDVSKIIYFDCDVLIRGDIIELFNENLEGKILGAARDPFIRPEYNIWLGISPSFHYFNAGVLLIDLDLWRKNDIETKLLDFMYKNPDKLGLADQDALNFIFATIGYKELSIRYNFLPTAVDFIKEPIPHTIHFAGSEKPWCRFSALPYRNEYFEILSKTPWKQDKFRRFMGASFAKKYYLYSILGPIYSLLKSIKKNIHNFY